MNYKAVIFDMDGVLINSELYWNEEDRRFFDKRGISFNHDAKAKMLGKGLRENMEWAKQYYNLSETVEELCRERVNFTEDIYVKKAGIMPGVEKMLTILKANNFKTAIASGSFLYRIETIVDRFGWKDYFDVLASTDNVNFIGKPDPAIYRYTGEQLGVSPGSCVVVEDSVNGVWAAKGAGMKCIAAPDSRWSYGDFSSADAVINTLEDPKFFEFLGIKESVII